MLGVGGYVYYDWHVVTDREKINEVINNSRASFAKRDVESLKECFTDDARINTAIIGRGLKRPDLVKIALVPPCKVRIRSLKVQILKTIANGSFIADVSVFQDQSSRNNSSFRIVFQMRLIGNEWKYSEVTVKEN